MNSTIITKAQEAIETAKHSGYVVLDVELERKGYHDGYIVVDGTTKTTIDRYQDLEVVSALLDTAEHMSALEERDGESRAIVLADDSNDIRVMAGAFEPKKLRLTAREGFFGAAQAVFSIHEGDTIEAGALEASAALEMAVSDNLRNAVLRVNEMRAWRTVKLQNIIVEHCPFTSILIADIDIEVSEEDGIRSSFNLSAVGHAMPNETLEVTNIETEGPSPYTVVRALADTVEEVKTWTQ